MSLINTFSRILVVNQGILRIFFSSSFNLLQSEPELKADISKKIDPEKDRSRKISVETSIKYLESKAYKQTYGDNLVWVLYRRNKTRHFLRDTRRTCIKASKISTGSPCPICRDEYLVLDHQNVKLIKQFISPYSGEILPTMKTGLCQRQHRNLLVAIQRAKDYGTITYDVPFRLYNYDFYKKKHVEEQVLV